MEHKIKELLVKVGAIGHDEDGNELSPILIGNQIEEFVKIMVLDSASYIEQDQGSGYALAERFKLHYGVKDE